LPAISGWLARESTLIVKLICGYGDGTLRSLGGISLNAAHQLPHILPHLVLHLLGQFRVGNQEVLHAVLALTNPLVTHGEPAAALLDNLQLHSQIHQLAPLADALTVENVKIGFPERRCNLILYHLDTGLVADNIAAFLD